MVYKDFDDVKDTNKGPAKPTVAKKDKKDEDLFGGLVDDDFVKEIYQAWRSKYQERHF